MPMIRSRSRSSRSTAIRPYHKPNFYFLRDKQVAPPSRPSQPTLNFEVSSQVSLGWRPEELGSAEPLPRNPRLGAALAPPGSRPSTPRDLVVGLDFGTSSTKVVIADRTMHAAYAVPFMDAVGVAAYLLPSALIENEAGTFALGGGGVRHADLKLAMLQDLSNDAACAKVCAFLALVIRNARAWLFETKADQLMGADILWSLALGQPADQVVSARHREHFEHLSKVAWQLASTPGDLPVEAALKAWRDRLRLNLDDELEVRPMAELSAQIHGFVSSSHFDSRHPNIYLLVDVGAGTVDATLFRVRKDRGGTVSFEFFTHGVELLGAANLNRARLRWWTSQLQDLARDLDDGSGTTAADIAQTIQEMDRLRLPTEFRGQYPDSFHRYVRGVDVQFEGGAKTPDEHFHQLLRNQVAGKVLYGAWKQQLLNEDAIRNMPFFLCGGGARHAFYASLKARLQRTPGCTWLSAQARRLAMPTNLTAPGVAHTDYDRLSVAYGLSQLNPGSFAKVTALQPHVPAVQSTDWSSRYVDKSAC